MSNNVTYATQGGESAYVWSVPGSPGTNYSIVSGGTSGTNSTVTLNWLTTGSQTVTVNYTDVNGCTGVSAATNTTTVNALPVPTFTSVPPSSTICPGVSVTYTTQTGGGINNYTWSVPGTAGTDYTITAGGTGLTAASNTTTVVPSSASFTLSANPVCLGSATTFNSGQPLCSGNALSFNGSSSNASITPVVSTAQNNITLEAWVNWSGATGSNQLRAFSSSRYRYFANRSRKCCRYDINGYAYSRHDAACSHGAQCGYVVCLSERGAVCCNKFRVNACCACGEFLDRAQPDCYRRI